jgi:hypothetical protein
MMRSVRPLDFGSELLRMNRSQGFFRSLWRVNAVLTFVAAAAVALVAGALLAGYLGSLVAGNREPAPSPLVAGPRADPGLFLTEASLLPRGCGAQRRGQRSGWWGQLWLLKERDIE